MKNSKYGVGEVAFLSGAVRIVGVDNTVNGIKYVVVWNKATIYNVPEEALVQAERVEKEAK